MKKIGFILPVVLVFALLPAAFGQNPTSPEPASAATPPASAAGQADMEVTEVSSGMYSTKLLREGVKVAQIKVDPQRGAELDNSAMFIDKRILFKGEIKEYVGAVDGPPAAGSTPRIVTAAHLSYNPLAAASSPGLAEAGVVDIDANGFVRSPNAKSGWVNRSVTLSLADAGKSRFIKLSNVTLWVDAGGQEWLAVSVGSAAVSDDEAAPGSAIEVSTSIAEGHAYLRVGQHRLRLVLPALADKLSYVDETKVTLNDAARSGDLDKVKAILAAEPESVSSRDTVSGTALMYAAVFGHRDVAEYLLAHRAEVDQVSAGGQTALMLAAVDGKPDVAELLLQHGANINAKSNDGSTPLSYAVSGGRFDVAKMLLDHGAGVNMSDASGLTPLHEAAGDGHKDLAELLLARGADLMAKDNHGATPLHYAAAKGHDDVAELLLEKGCDVNIRDSAGATPLHWAAGNGRKETAEFLLRNKADVNAIEDGVMTPMYVAAHYKHPEVAADLKERGGRDFIGEMLDAAKRGDIGTVTALLADHPTLVNCTGESNGWTPLHYAADGDRKDLAELLLRNKADVNAKSKLGDTPMEVAASKRHKDMEKLLRRQGGR